MNTLFDICEKENLTYEELKEGIDKFSSEINSENKDQESALTLLCKQNPKLELIKLMVQSGANVNIPNINHYLPCLFSSKKDFELNVVEYLIELGCDIGYKIRYSNNTILHQIINVRAFSIKKLEILMKLKPNMIKEVNINNISPLMYLCEFYPELELIKLFIKYGADPKPLDSFKNHCLTYLFFSKEDFDINVVEYLISQGCDIEGKNKYDTMLHKILICEGFTTKKLEILMKLKPDMINEIDNYGVTPLMCICQYYPDLELVKLFVEYGAKVDSVDHKNKNCLFYLFNGYENFDLNIAKYLISQGCKFTESIDGLTVLSLFDFNMSFEKINFLAEYNQKIDRGIVRQYFNFKHRLSFYSNQLFY